jgi:hypothetical protein
MNVAKLGLVLVCLTWLVSCREKEQAVSTPPRSLPDTTVNAQPDNAYNSYASVDISPMDMSYFPVDYPKLKMANENITPPLVRVVYSRPHLGKRHFHDILKYGTPWRLGANESTEISFYKPVTILGKKVPAGRYILYCVPQPDSWTMVLNTNIDTWGLKQDSLKDVDRFEVPVSRNNPPLEFFTMVFEKTATGADLVIGWDDVIGRMPIVF